MTDGVGLERGAGLLRNGEGGGVLDDLLETALQGAVALAEVDDVAVLVREDLHFDVLRVHEELLDEDVIVVERLFCFSFDEAEGVAHFRDGVAAAHASSAAAGRRFQDDREAEGLGDADRVFRSLDRFCRAGDGGDFGGEGDLLGLQFVAHFGKDGRRRSDECDVVVFTGFGELGVLGQEAVAGVDGIHTVVLREFDDRRDVEVGLQRALVLADEVRFVRLHAEQRVDVLIGIHRHRIDAQIVAGAENTDRDLTAVGGKDFVECRRLHVFNHPIFHGFFYIFNNRCK